MRLCPFGFSVFCFAFVLKLYQQLRFTVNKKALIRVINKKGP